MKKHYLKKWPEFFKAVASGFKGFEIRINDRKYEVGDILVLQEWDNKKEKYTGNEIEVTVTYIFSGGSFGVSKDTVVMSIKHYPRVVFNSEIFQE